MNQLILKSKSKHQLKELVIAALEAERKELLTASLKTKNCLSEFEHKHHISTSKFISKGSESLKIDDMEAIEWEGEYETLNRIQERLGILKEIKICT